MLARIMNNTEKEPKVTNLDLDQTKIIFLGEGSSDHVTIPDNEIWTITWIGAYYVSTNAGRFQIAFTIKDSPIASAYVFSGLMAAGEQQLVSFWPGASPRTIQVPSGIPTQAQIADIPKAILKEGDQLIFSHAEAGAPGSAVITVIIHYERRWRWSI